MKCIFFSFLILISHILSPKTVFSQNKWNILFGTEEYTGLIRKNLPEDLPNRIVQSNDGGYIVSGTNHLMDGNPKPNSMGSWVAKFNAEGKHLWYKVGDPSFYTFAPNQLTALSAGGFVVTGRAGGESSGFGNDGIILFKFNNDGELINKQSYLTKSLKAGEKPGEQSGIPLYTWENTDGNIAVLAQITIRIEELKDGYIYNGLHNRVWLLTFNQNLELLTTSDLNIEYVTNFDQRFCKDGSFYVTNTDPLNNKKLSLYKFNKMGEKQWETEKIYDGEISYAGISLFESGKILLFANIDCYKPGESNVYTIFDTSGQQEAENKVKYAGFIINTITVDNDYIVNYQIGVGEGNFCALKTNISGKEHWKKCFGVKGTLFINGIQATDKGFALLGYTKDYGANYVDVLIIKTDADGNTIATPKKYTKATP